jgi:hypothetical protein
MQEDRPLMVTRFSAEATASAGLDAVCRWVIAGQCKPVRLGVDDLPAIGQASRLRLDRPITAPRAVLCAVWLLEDVDAGGCLLAGQLRFVAHPTGSEIRLNFSGRTAAAMRSGVLRREADHAATQLLEVIAETIERPHVLARSALRAQSRSVRSARRSMRHEQFFNATSTTVGLSA